MASPGAEQRTARSPIEIAADRLSPGENGIISPRVFFQVFPVSLIDGFPRISMELSSPQLSLPEGGTTEFVLGRPKFCADLAKLLRCSFDAGVATSDWCA